MRDNREGKIREIHLEDHLMLREALELARSVFMQTTACDYEEQGIETFQDFIHIDNIRKQMLNKRFRIWCYTVDCGIRGIIGVRERTHLSLLFVEKDYWGRGIARQLFERAFLEEEAEKEVSVHSSPYAVPAYQALGFEIPDVEQVKDGIRYTPMLYRGKKRKQL